MFINKVMLYGNITKDLELKTIPSGKNVLSFSIATNRDYKDGDGSKQQDTQYHNCVAWGKTGELIAQYLGKGSAIYIEGRLQTRSYDDKKTGTKRYTTEVVVESMQFGPKGAGGKKETADDSPQDEEAEAIGSEDETSNLPF